MFNRFTDEAKEAVVRAQEIARLAGARNITDAHLLVASVEFPVGYVLVRLVGGSPERLSEILHRQESDTQVSGHIPFTRATKKLIERSLRESLRLSHSVISSGHLVAASAGIRSPTGRDALTRAGADTDSVRPVLQRFDFLSHTTPSDGIHQHLFRHVTADEEGTRWLLRDEIEWAIIRRADLRRGLQIFETAVDRYGVDAFAFHAVVVGELSGDVDLIIDNADRAVEQRADREAEIQAALALALAEADRPPEARLALTKALAAGQSASVLVDAAKTEWVIGDGEAASEYLKRAREADGRDATTTAWQISLLELQANHRGNDAVEAIAGAKTSTSYHVLLRGLARSACAWTMGPGPAAIQICDQIAEEYRRLGMYEPVLAALTHKARMLRQLQRSEEEDAVNEVGALARSLGRKATVRRLAEDLG